MGLVLLLAWLGCVAGLQAHIPYCMWPSAGPWGLLTRAALSPGFSHPCVCYFYHVWDLLSATCPGLDPHPAFVIVDILEQSLRLLELEAAGRQRCALGRLAWGC